MTTIQELQIKQVILEALKVYNKNYLNEGGPNVEQIVDKASNDIKVIVKET